ncbi:Putative transposase for insertion sequence element IS112 [Frankliniella fusca]|uniref:Transposase for insertion sequence element IS112 n=1 Tax=Frankliniella fusca TaxID=407009 RepID=A0AAE1HJZ3_9NEOP|nr:Putative transposase for insertion sequence element IS112 [Frankliniella fusca]
MPYMAVSAKQQNRNKPQCFAPYKNLRIIIDCAEFQLERSSNLQQQSNTFSDYKHCNTGKVLIGISCYRGVSFVSSCFEGRISDKEIVLKSGLMDILEKGDTVMADRGFRLEEEMKNIGVTLIKPPDKPRKSAHLTARQEIQTKSIASVRIYVEHVIGKIKDWLILAHRVELMNNVYLEDFVLIAAFLYNFTRIYIGQEKDKKKEQSKKKD